MPDNEEPSNKRPSKVTRIHARRGADERVPDITGGSDKGDEAKPLVPPGMLELVVTYLEMTRPPVRSTRPRRLEALSVVKAHYPTASFYRYLYNTVGERWLWYERRQLADSDLLEIIHDPRVEIFVLYLEGVPAGYVELTRYEDSDDMEISYFGLIPDFIGRGLGPWFLDWAVGKAWAAKPTRLLVNTCNLDHPKAIAVYQKAGFKPYKQRKELIVDPRESGEFS